MNHHLLFIHSPIVGYPGFFQVLAITNKAAICNDRQVLFGREFSAPLGKYQGTQWVDLRIRVEVYSNFCFLL